MSDESRIENTESIDEEQPASVPERRSFLATALGVATAAISALVAIPLGRFALYPFFTKTTETKWSDVGPLDSFTPLTEPLEKIVTVSQLDGWRESVSREPVYVTKTKEGQIEVLSGVCPHLGCEVPWNPERHEFFCPCHGSVFAPDGSRISGPAPRGLDSLTTTVENGRLLVRYQRFRQLLPNKEVVG